MDSWACNLANISKPHTISEKCSWRLVRPALVNIPIKQDEDSCLPVQGFWELLCQGSLLIIDNRHRQWVKTEEMLGHEQLFIWTDRQTFSARSSCSSLSMASLMVSFSCSLQTKRKVCTINLHDDLTSSATEIDIGKTMVLDNWPICIPILLQLVGISVELVEQALDIAQLSLWRNKAPDLRLSLPAVRTKSTDGSGEKWHLCTRHLEPFAVGTQTGEPNANYVFKSIKRPIPWTPLLLCVVHLKLYFVDCCMPLHSWK